MNKLPVSLVIITHNEEANIARCIESAPFVSEIVVVDSGSTDNTLAIAQKYGAKTHHLPWQGFGPQKNAALELASHNWVLSLDADEALSPELAQEIQALFTATNFNSHDAYVLPRLNWFCGRWMRHSGMYPDYQTRLLQKHKVKWTSAQVHEKVVAKNSKTLSQPILHWSFRNISHQVETINRYSTLRAQEFFKKNKTSGPLKIFLKTFSKFFEIYFLKRGFLDGVQGLMVSITGAFATYLRWAKLYELRMAKKHDQ